MEVPIAIVITLVLVIAVFIYRIPQEIKKARKDVNSSMCKAEYREKLEGILGEVAAFSMFIFLVTFLLGTFIFKKMNLVGNGNSKAWLFAIGGNILACVFIIYCCKKGYMSQKTNLIKFLCTSFSLGASLISYLFLDWEENWILSSLVMFYLTIDFFIQLYQLLDV